MNCGCSWDASWIAKPVPLLQAQRSRWETINSAWRRRSALQEDRLAKAWCWETQRNLPRPEYPDEHRAEVSDTVSWVLGNHTLKFGADWDRNEDLLDNVYDGVGEYHYTSFGSFLADYYHAVDGLGPPHSYFVNNYAGFSQSFGPGGFFITTNDWAGFADDEWRTFSRLTVTAGVRYEYERVPRPFLANPQLPQTENYPDDRNNIAPRAGVAWDLFGNGNTILRAGVWHVLWAHRERHAAFRAGRFGIAGIAADLSLFLFHGIWSAAVSQHLFQCADRRGARRAAQRILFRGQDIKRRRPCRES